MEKKTIGSLICAMRRAAGMTQRDLAERLNVSDKAVSRWERDESAPDLTLLPMIADLFGITVDELLRGQRKPAEPISAAAVGEQSTPPSPAPSAAPNTKFQKAMFGKRLRRHRLLNYIPIGLAAAGVIAALLCNFAAYRAALGFFLGLLFEVAAVICALAFGSAALPTVDDAYDAALLQDYVRRVVRTTTRSLLCALLSLPLLCALLVVWVAHGALVGLAASMSELLLLFVVTLLWGLLLREVSLFVALPRVERRLGVASSEREEARVARVGQLARRCALGLVCAMVLPLLTFGVMTCGMIDPETAFAKPLVFDDYDAFCDYMAREGKYGTTEHWDEDDYDNGGIARELISLGVASPPWVSVEVEVPGEHIGENTPPKDPDPDSNVTPTSQQHRVIEDGEGRVLAEFDWINADVAYVEWSFNAAGDNHGLPIVVYTADEVMDSRALYDTLTFALGALLIALPVGTMVLYAVKRTTA